MAHVQRLAPLLLLLCLSVGRVCSGQDKVIHSFSPRVDGNQPAGSLIFDAKGNLYGTTEGGGPVYFGGTVFELSPVPGGGWTEKILYNFNNSRGSRDGFFPGGTLIADGNGNLYGTTISGGLHAPADPGNVPNGGTVFELSPANDGSWTKTLLYSFAASATDGFLPNGNLVIDGQGNLYGTTSFGGAFSDGGTLFELTHGPGGWTEKVLHNFGQTSTDGSDPLAGLAIDPAGNLYGTTNRGGTYEQGTVFELSSQHDGTWIKTILHNFNASQGDGIGPRANLILDGSGNLYGTTTAGGTEDSGTVFELSPAAGAAWTEKLFSVYSVSGLFGAYPTGPVTLDSHGNLYVTTSAGGGSSPFSGTGLVIELTPEPNAIWKETILDQFDVNQGTQAIGPMGGVILDSQGNLYGTTSGGGTYNAGTVFGIGPGPADTTTNLGIDPNAHLVAGELITLTATVTVASGTAVTTGTVVFSDPEVPRRQVEVPLNSVGQAIYSTRVPQAGTYSIVANYGGAEGFVASTSDTITQPVH